MFSFGLFAGFCLNSYFEIHTPDTYKLPWTTTKASRYSKEQVSSMRRGSLIRLAVKLQAKDCCALLPVLTLFLPLWSTRCLCFGLLNQIHWESPERQNRPQPGYAVESTCNFSLAINIFSKNTQSWLKTDWNLSTIQPPTTALVKWLQAVAITLCTPCILICQGFALWSYMDCSALILPACKM